MTWRHQDRFDLLRISAALGLFACILVSWPMWWPRQDMPHFSAFAWLSHFATSAGTESMCLLLVGLCTTLLIRQRWVLWGTASLLVWVVGLDLLRLQPWAFQYACLFVVLGAVGRRPANEGQWWKLLQFMHVCIYIWSGIHKLNPTFGNASLPFFFQPLPTAVQSALFPRWALALGLLVACIEIGLGLMLWWGRHKPALRYLGLGVATTMHLGLSGFFLAKGYDANVIPWNLGMAVMAWLLFWRPRSTAQREDTSDEQVTTPDDAPTPQETPEANAPSPPSKGLSMPARLLALGMVLLFGVMPGLHVVGWWDANLSFALYSNSYTAHQFYVLAPHHKRLPAAVKPYLAPPMQQAPQPGQPPPQGPLPEWVRWEGNRWAMTRFRTTVPPTKWFGKTVFRTLCRRWPSSALRLEIIPPRRWGPLEPKPTYLRCPSKPK